MRKKSDLTKAREVIGLAPLERYRAAIGVPQLLNPQIVRRRKILGEAYRIRYEDHQDTQALLEYIAFCGEEALAAQWVQVAIGWLRYVLDPDFSLAAQINAKARNYPPDTYLFVDDGVPVSKKEAEAIMEDLRKEARLLLRAIGPALANVVGSGRNALSAEQRETIAADCKKWLPICQQLNKVFKRLWDDPAWRQVSKEKQEEIYGQLATKHSISAQEVHTIERYLKTASGSSQATPWDATMAMVSEMHNWCGAGTVEKIYQDLKADPSA